MKALKLILPIFLVTVTQVMANNLPPIADIDNSPGRNWFYNGELITFDGSSSYDQDESGNSITNYVWYVQIGSGSYVTKKSGSSASDYQVCFEPGGSAYATTGNGCLALGSNTTVKIRLKVTDDEGSNDYGYTSTLTIKAPSARRYFVTDHIGSVRVTLDEDGEVMGADDYYPFGLEMPDRSANSANPNDNYKFIGHERDDEAGLTLDYMMARTYDPVIGRFLQIDPSVEKFPDYTPFIYSYNRPLNFLDPDGREGENCCLDYSARYVTLNRDAVAQGKDPVEYIEEYHKAQAVNTAIFTTAFLPGPEDLIFTGIASRFAGVGARAKALINSARYSKQLKSGGGIIDASGNFRKLSKVNKADAAADDLAARIGGESRVTIEGIKNEFDVVSDKYIGQTTGKTTLNKAFRDQAKDTFEAAQQTGRDVLYELTGDKDKLGDILNKLLEYRERYDVNLKIIFKD